jgi:hypothetical protein
VVDIAIIPYKDTVLILRFIVDKLADVNIAHDVLHAIAVFAVVLEVTLVKSQRRVQVKQQAKAVVVVVASVPEVKSSGCFQQYKLAVLGEHRLRERLELGIGVVR